MSCKHTWLSMEQVRKGLTKIKCNECNKTMGIVEATLVKTDFTLGIARLDESKGSLFDKTDIEDQVRLFEEIFNDIKEARLDREIIAKIYRQSYQGRNEVNGEVRELSDEEREELK